MFSKKTAVIYLDPTWTPGRAQSLMAALLICACHRRIVAVDLGAALGTGATVALAIGAAIAAILLQEGGRKQPVPLGGVSLFIAPTARAQLWQGGLARGACSGASRARK